MDTIRIRTEYGEVEGFQQGEVMTFLWDGDVRSLPEKGEKLYREAYLQHRLPIGPFGFEIVRVVIEGRSAA